MKKLIALLLCASAAGARPKSVTLKTVPALAALRYAGSSQQFLAIATDADGTERDVTGEAEWRISNPALAQVSDVGRVTAIADGSVSIRATFSGARAESSVRIQGSQTARPFSFARDIGGILTKRGCNQAACHGGVKGRGGLKFSANALYPKDDYEWITKGGVYQVLTAEVPGVRIPRVDVKNPAASCFSQSPRWPLPTAAVSDWTRIRKITRRSWHG
jgi:Bacterial Ig-like domain (group 2).